LVVRQLTLRAPDKTGAFFLTVDICRRPIGGAARKPVFGCFPVVINRGGLPDKCGPVFETVGVDDRASTGRRDSPTRPRKPPAPVLCPLFYLVEIRRIGISFDRNPAPAHGCPEGYNENTAIA
jgi:hypothetical protein